MCPYTNLTTERRGRGGLLPFLLALLPGIVFAGFSESGAQETKETGSINLGRTCCRSSTAERVINLGGAAPAPGFEYGRASSRTAIDLYWYPGCHTRRFWDSAETG